jgi:hypothetical protein
MAYLVSKKPRLAVLTIWAFVTGAVFMDYVMMDLLDVVILTVLSFLILLIALGSNPRLKLVLILSLGVIGFGFAYSLDPLLRSLIQHKKEIVGDSYSEGIKSFYNAIKCFRPYGTISIGGLFAMAVTSLINPSRDR